MSEHDSTPASKPSKPATKAARPAKPRPDFPLFPHASGQWAKKVRGRMCYFGKWNDPEGAEERYKAEKDALEAEPPEPPPDPAAVTCKEMCNAFMAAKQHQLDAGELSKRTLYDYKRDCELLLAAFGKGRAVTALRPSDFASLRATLATRYGPHRISVTIARIRVLFNFAFDNELIAAPIRYGSGFDRPSAKTMRKHRAEQGPRLFEADEVRRMLSAAGQPLRAMLLLGINCGFGNTDCGTLELRHLDVDGGWANFPRPKTGVQRRCPLWPETVEAIKDWLAVRPKPKDPANAPLVFLTTKGGTTHKILGNNPITTDTGKLLRRLGINGRKGLGFYTLRHIFRTIADEAKDQPACDALMGHETGHISSHYREKIADARLKAVAEHVRSWLYPPPPASETPATLPMKPMQRMA
jgi:integrase